MKHVLSTLLATWRASSRSSYHLFDINERKMAARSGSMDEQHVWDHPNTAVPALKNLIRAVPDFPKPGIIFRDIMPIFKCPKAVKAFTEIMAAYIEVHHPAVTAIVGLDARGFLFGPVIALLLEKPFIAVRKGGKLPGAVLKTCSTKEYGSDVLEIQADALTSGDKVVIVDDLLATGGTLCSTCDLVHQSGAEVLGSLCIVELTYLHGKDKVTVPFHSLVSYDS